MMVCTEGNTNRVCSFVLGGMVGFVGCVSIVGWLWMEENKKSGGGDVRAKVLSWDGARKKAASPKKSRLRRKKNCGYEFRVGAEKVLQFGYLSYCHSRCLVGFLMRNYIAAIGRGQKTKYFPKKMVRILTILQIIIIFAMWIGNICV